MELSVFCHGSLSLEQRVWSEANQREKRRVREFKGQREIFGLVAYQVGFFFFPFFFLKIGNFNFCDVMLVD